MASAIPHPHEMYIRECDRCAAVHPVHGGRCKRQTCKVWPYCWQHMKLIMGLAAGRTTLAGVGGCGLLAVRPSAMWTNSNQVMLNDAEPDLVVEGRHVVFRPNKFISPYTGEDLTLAEEQARYNNHGDTQGRYLMTKGPGALAALSVDAIRTTTAPARFANHNFTAAARNATFTYRGAGVPQQGPWLRSSKRIFEGQEVFVSYANNFQVPPAQWPDEKPIPASRRLCR